MFGEDLKHALATARNEARRLRHESVRPEHHALGVLLTPSETVSIIMTGVRATELVSELEQLAGLGSSALWIHDLPCAESTKIVIEHTVREARTLGHEVVGSDHLLLGLLQVAGSLPQAVFEAHGVTIDRAREVVRVARSQGAV